MFKNYFIVAVRNFWRHKIFSSINVLGLAIGISASLVIYLIVHYEFSFDMFEKNGDRIYRVVTNMHFPDQDFKNSGVPDPLPAAVKNEVTGIEMSARFSVVRNLNVKVDDNKNSRFINQPNVIFAEPDYFKLIHYKFLAGSAEALSEPYKVVLIESRAKEYFGSVPNAMNKTISYNDSVKAIVAGVVKDIDQITDFTFKEFISIETAKAYKLDNFNWNEWGSVSSSSQFFIKLKPGVSPAQINNQLAALRKKYGKDAGLKTDHFLQALHDIHFNTDFDNFDQRQADKTTMDGLLLVAIFLLLLGCINFINLNTAQASQRAKEIGVRKTMGSSRKQLIFQYISETFVLTCMATVLSLALTPLLLNAFRNFIPQEVNFQMVEQPHVIIFLIGITVLVSVLAGFYPALVLSKYKPALVLKNQAFGDSSKSRKAWVRKSLTITQFVVAQVFIIATLIVGKQIQYSLNKNMGFRKDAIVIINIPWRLAQDSSKKYYLLNELKAIPEIEDVVLAGAPPASPGYSVTTMKYNDGKKEVESTVETKQADKDYFKLYNLKLVAGNYPESSDTVKDYLINETFAKFLGFKNPAEAIGKNLNENHPIVGVMKDFNSKSTHTPIGPLAYSAGGKNYNYLHVLLKPQQGSEQVWQHAIEKMQKAWKDFDTDDSFDYKFFDDTIAQFYETEQNISKLLKWATGLAIFISCLGLLGLVIYTTNQRTKEIGVRKVLGASVKQIVLLLSKDLMRLVIIAVVVSVPIAWWAMNKWLQEFAYKTSLNWWIFALGCFGMILIAFIILSVRAIKAAMANPVKSLRTE